MTQIDTQPSGTSETAIMNGTISSMPSPIEPPGDSGVQKQTKPYIELRKPWRGKRYSPPNILGFGKRGCCLGLDARLQSFQIYNTKDLAIMELLHLKTDGKKAMEAEEDDKTVAAGHFSFKEVQQKKKERFREEGKKLAPRLYFLLTGFLFCSLQKNSWLKITSTKSTLMEASKLCLSVLYLLNW